jgi:hypothetical protein
VARRPSSNPAFPKINAPVQTEANVWTLEARDRTKESMAWLRISFRVPQPPGTTRIPRLGPCSKVTSGRTFMPPVVLTCCPDCESSNTSKGDGSSRRRSFVQTSGRKHLKRAAEIEDPYFIENYDPDSFAIHGNLAEHTDTLLLHSKDSRPHSVNLGRQRLRPAISGRSLNYPHLLRHKRASTVLSCASCEAFIALGIHKACGTAY